MDKHPAQPATTEQLLELENPTPAQEQQLEAALAAQLPPAVDWHRQLQTAPAPLTPEFTALLQRRAEQTRLGARRRAVRMAGVYARLVVPPPGMRGTC